MITQIDISNFKIHDDTRLRIAPLTILTGVNGMGKSSVTQALLMLRESIASDSPSYPRALRLKGNAFDIEDQSGALVNWYHDKEADRLKINLEFTGAEAPLVFQYIYPKSNETELLRDPATEEYSLRRLQQESLFSDSFQYLSAWRYGPEHSYSGDTNCVERKQVSRVRGRGEYAVAILDRYANVDIPSEARAFPDFTGAQPDLSLKTQVSLWLGRISPRVRLSINSDGNDFLLRYNYPGPNGRLRSVAPLNTGFGISYVLSAIVALLITPAGGLVVLENPEAHLHPAAQSAFMDLVSRAVASGVQVVIETHSDHIVFGALVNMKRKILGKDCLGIYLFDTDDNTGRLAATPVTVGPDCRKKNPPRHFIEQMNLDLDILFDE